MNLDETYQQIPPHDIEAEVCTLGSMMLDASTIPLVQQFVAAEDFYRPAHQLIFNAILDIQHELNLKMLDLVALRKRLEDKRQLKSVGGVEYIEAIVNGVPSATNAAYYAGTVAEKAVLRRMILAASTVRAEAFAPGARSEDILSLLQGELATMAPAGGEKRTAPACEAADEVLRRSEAVARGETAPGMSLGFPSLDQCSGGVQPGEVVYVAGATSVGKTSLALRFAANAAMAGASVRFFSAEMSNTDIAQRLIQMLSGVNGLKIQGGRQSVSDWDRTAEAAEVVRGWGDRVQITDEPMGVGRMESEIRAMSAKQGKPVGLVVVDYLQILPSKEGRDIRERINGITRGLKLMARRLETRIVVLSQLNRSAQRERRHPELWELKESSSIEQDADGVVLLWAPTEPETAPGGGMVIWCAVAKWRNGRTTRWEGPGAIRLVFCPGTTDYAEL